MKGIQLQKINITIQLVSNENGDLKLHCEQQAFIGNLIKVFGILVFEGYTEFIDLVNDKKDAAYQDFSIFFQDGVVEYCLGAPAGQVSEPLFFEVLSYFLASINPMEKTSEVFEKHLSALEEAPGIKSNIEAINSLRNK